MSRNAETKRTKIDKVLDFDSDGSDVEHDLTYLTNNRIKLIQNTLKIIKPKKLMKMAPDCLKDLPKSQVKSLLLEELMGISNKRLHHILKGERINSGSSSSDSETEKIKEADIISLDDITDGSEICISDDNIMEMQVSERERLELEIDGPKKGKRKERSKKVRKKIHIKKEKLDKPITVKKEKVKCTKKKPMPNPSNGTGLGSLISQDLTKDPEDPVMSVLNLLELQARARAIRSQIANEITVKKSSSTEDISIPIEGVSEQPITIEHQQEDLVEVVPEQPLGSSENIVNSKCNESPNSVIFVSPHPSPVVHVSFSDSETEHDSSIDKIKPVKVVVKLGKETVMGPECSKDGEKCTDDVESLGRDGDSDDVLIVNNSQEIDDLISESDKDNTSQDVEVKTVTSENDDKKQIENYTWKSRWLDSQKVKDIMRTTKLYNNIRQSRKQKQYLSGKEQKKSGDITKMADDPPEVDN